MRWWRGGWGAWATAWCMWMWGAGGGCIAFSKRLNNEVRAQVAHDLEYETPHAPLAQEPAIGPDGYAPQVSIAPNGFSFGTPTSMAPGAAGGRSAYPDETRFELADTLQWHVGRHLLMVGADWSRIHDRIDTLSAEEGAFSYDSGTTNGKDGGLVDWITDYTFNVNAYPNGALSEHCGDGALLLLSQFHAELWGDGVRSL